MKERNSWPAGIKKTRQREGILSVLERSERPLSVAEICAQLEQNGEDAWLSTAYRALDLFVKKGMVLKINILSTNQAVYKLNRSDQKHYAICMNCHKMIAMDNCPMEVFVPNLEEDGFLVTGHSFEIYGLCKDCSLKK